MELTVAGLGDTQRAFDGVAPTYDAANAANPIICAMRARTLAAVTSALPAGSSLLDLGCGPGEDATRLARAGYRVMAIDWSSAMAQQARNRVAACGLDADVRVATLGIHELDQLAPEHFDGAYSNLGPLNCVPDLRAAASSIFHCLRPGGVFVASVIGRVCPWEIARYGIAGNWRRAGIRFSTSFVPVPLEGRTVWTRYYSPAQFARDFRAAGFRTMTLSALGLFVPPPYLAAFYERHRGVMRWLDALERRTAAWPGLRQCGDHFLVVMKRP